MRECNKIKSLFGPYLYNVVTPTERAAVEEHIAKCEKCAHDLRSRQMVLESLKSRSQLGEIPQRTQDDFAWNVYRKIASDVLRRRSRQILLRRFVLQPSLAVVVLAAGIALSVLRFHSGPVVVHEPSSVVVKADEADKKELREALYVEEFFKQYGTPYERESGYVAVDQASAVERSSPDLDRLMKDVLLTDSRRLLEDANFINYSLRDPERALPKYRRLIDYHPNTEEATEARVIIKSILDSEYGIQTGPPDAGQVADMGI